MSGWAELGLAFALFAAAHLIPVRAGLRPYLVGFAGQQTYLASYALVSVGLLAWLIVAAGRAPYVGLWASAPWQAWTALVAMAPVCMLVALGLGVPNPFSFGGGDAARFDPSRPRIVGVTRHPLLWALAVWAGAHLLANGDLAHLLLFGGFLVMALTGIVQLDRRARRRLGDARWVRLARRNLTGWRGVDALRLAGAVLLYAALLLAHSPVIGVSPTVML